MKYGLSQKQLQDIKTILAAWPDIESAWLFGSRALGSYKEASDIDLAIKGRLDHKTLIRLKDAFEDSDLPFFVDLVEYEGITEPALKKHIDVHGVCIYGEGKGVSTWEETTLGTVATIKHGWPFKSECMVDQQEGKPVVVSIGNFNYQGGFRFSETKLREYVGEYPNEYLLLPGDILLIMTCQTEGGEILGIPGIIPNDKKKYLHNQRLGKLVIHNTKKAIQDFLYYYFLTQDFNQQLVGSASGTKIVHTAPSRIEACVISLPPLAEQRVIAALLRGIDDKIDLLHRQNKTLEAMAETLFRGWFGDDASADWPEGTVEDLFVLQRGYDLPTQDRIDGPYPIITSSGHSGSHVDYKVKPPGVVTGRSGLLGKVFLVQEDFWPLNTSLYVKEFKRGRPLFTYLFLKTMDLPAFNAGSAVPTLNRNHVHAHPVFLPPRELIERFESTVEPLFRKVHGNGAQIATLETLRDTLLPKLMSGEVRVKF